MDYKTNPQYYQEVLNAKGLGSQEGFGNAIEGLASGPSKAALWLMGAANCPDCALTDIQQAWSAVASLPEELKYKGYLDNLHIMQGKGFEVTKGNAASSTELGVDVGLSVAPVLSGKGRPGNAGAGGAQTNISTGAENIATYPKLKDQLTKQNLSNIAAQDHRLAEAVKGSGTANPNFSIGGGTAAEADRLGRIWVGDGARLTKNGKGWISADETRIYRFPAEKPQALGKYSKSGVQANFELYNNGGLISNGHLEIAK